MTNKPVIEAIDHLVLTAADVAATIEFYTRVLGMTAERFQPADGSPPRQALLFGRQKINLHDAASPYSPHAAVAKPGTADLCFLSPTPIAEWQEHLAVLGIALEQGPVAKTGATGRLCSIYIRDPDGNLLEISNLQ